MSVSGDCILITPGGDRITVKIEADESLLGQGANWQVEAHLTAAQFRKITTAGPGRFRLQIHEIEAPCDWLADGSASPLHGGTIRLLGAGEFQEI